MRRAFFLFLFLTLIAPFAAYGEETSLGEVQVQGNQDNSENPEAFHDPVSFTTVITAKEMKGRTTSIPEVLQEVSGVQVRQRGGFDDFATVGIRGSTSEQVAVYLDGILLNPAVGGGVNLSTIPTDQIERIEVYKGAAPAWFGTSSIGGVVNIVTKKGEKGHETAINQSYGSFETYEGSLLQSQTFKNFDYHVGYTYSRSQGDFTYLNDNGTPFNPNDDQLVKRENNEYERNNLLTDFTWAPQTLGGVSIHFQDQFFQEGRGIPGFATLTSDNAHLTTYRNGTSVEIVKKDLFKNFNLAVIPFFEFLNQKYQDPDGDVGLGVQNNDNDTFQYGSTIRSDLFAGKHQHLGLYLEYRGEQFLPVNYTDSPPDGPVSVRNSFSSSLEDEIFFFNEKLILNPSVRLENVSNRQGGVTTSTLNPVSGKLGIKYQPFGTGSAGGPVAFKTNISRSYRLPNFSELYGDRGTFIGNPDLAPEKGINWDIGAILNFREMKVVSFPLRFEASYYLSRVDDLIQFLQTSQFTVQAQNLATARIQGAEAAVYLSLFNHFDIDANYTFQWAKDISGLPGINGKFLPGRPIHQAGSKASLYNHWGKIFTELAYLDGNYLDSQNVLRVDHRLLLASGVSFFFFKWFTASFESKNILDDRISDFVGFPLPGRSYYGKLEFKI